MVAEEEDIRPSVGGRFPNPLVREVLLRGAGAMNLLLDAIHATKLDHRLHTRDLTRKGNHIEHPIAVEEGTDHSHLQRYLAHLLLDQAAEDDRTHALREADLVGSGLPETALYHLALPQALRGEILNVI